MKKKKILGILLLAALSLGLNGCFEDNSSSSKSAESVVEDSSIMFSGELVESNVNSNVSADTVEADDESEIEKMQYIAAIPTNGSNPVVVEIDENASFELPLDDDLYYLFKLLDEYGLPEKELNFSISGDSAIANIQDDLDLTITIDESERVDIENSSIVTNSKDTVNADIVGAGLITTVKTILNDNPEKGTYTENENGDITLTLKLAGSDSVEQEMEFTILSASDENTETGDLNFDEEAGIELTTIIEGGEPTIYKYDIESNDDAFSTVLAIDEVAEDVAGDHSLAQESYKDSAIEDKVSQITDERAVEENTGNDDNDQNLDQDSDDDWTPGDGWELSWGDEFSGSTLDDANWTHQIEAARRFNNELQAYTDSIENSYVQDGSMVIEAKKDGDSYTSARMITHGKVSTQYGKVAARIKVPYGQGVWPAFWMLGSNIDENDGGTVAWPYCGEIDILEKKGGTEVEEKTLMGTIHYWKDSGNYKTHEGGSIQMDEELKDDYHVYEVEWSDDLIIWKIDGEQYHAIDTSSSDYDEFDEDFYILLNLAIGGDFDGAPDENTIFPQKMLVDWVRIYEGGEVVDTGNIEGNGTDGEIEFDGDIWTLWSEGRTTATIEDGMAKLETTDLGDVWWKTQFYQEIDFTNKEEGSYQLSFDVKAEDATDMVVQFNCLLMATTLPVDSEFYDGLDSQIRYDVSTEMVTITQNVELFGFDPGATLKLNFGFGNVSDSSVPTTVYLDNVSLTKLGADGTPDTDNDNDDSDDTDSPLSIIFVGGSTSAEMNVGDVKELPAPSMTYSDGTFESIAPPFIKWTSSDSSVADLNQAFWLEAYGAGTAIITGTYADADGNTYADTLEVTVTGDEESSDDSEDSNDSGDTEDSDDSGVPVSGTLYSVTDGAIYTDVSEPSWGPGSSLVALNKTDEGTYSNVMEWSMGTEWGGAVACGFNNLSGLGSYTTLNVKFKYTDTEAASPGTFEVQMTGAPTVSVTIYDTDTGNWTDLSNGWVQVSIPLSRFGSLTGVEQMVFIVKDPDTSNPVYFTDINFE